MSGRPRSTITQSKCARPSAASASAPVETAVTVTSPRLDQVRHRGELRDVVFDDEDVARGGVGEAEQIVEGLRQRVFARRLLEVRERAGVERVLPLLFAGDDVHRDRLRRRIVLELVEQRPAVDVGKPDVERDRVGDELARERDARRRRVRRHEPLEAAVAREPEQDAREGRVVLDDEHDAVLRPHVVAVVVDRAARDDRRRRRGARRDGDVDRRRRASRAAAPAAARFDASSSCGRCAASGW